MRASELSELAAFDAVARHRSFRRAGEERGVTASAISHAVSSLEARLGVRLLNRTTRSVSLTDAGAMLLANLSPAFEDIGSALDGLNQFRDTPFGRVRINVPNAIAPYVIGPAIGGLLADNPKLELEIVATNRLVDIVAEGFDAGIRLGESLRDGMTAVKIRPRMRFAVVASPGYFATRPMPETPTDLRGHACIRNLYPTGTPYAWSFRLGHESVEFEPSWRLSLDDHEMIVQAALSGMAVAYTWEARVRPYIEDGRLVSCLEPWCMEEDWFYLYYPTRKHISGGLAAVIQALRAG